MPRDKQAVTGDAGLPELPGMPIHEAVARNGTAHGSTEELGDTWDLTRLRLAQDFSSAARDQSLDPCSRAASRQTRICPGTGRRRLATHHSGLAS